MGRSGAASTRAWRGISAGTPKYPAWRKIAGTRFSAFYCDRQNGLGGGLVGGLGGRGGASLSPIRPRRRPWRRPRGAGRRCAVPLRPRRRSWGRPFVGGKGKYKKGSGVWGQHQLLPRHNSEPLKTLICGAGYNRLLAANQSYQKALRYGAGPHVLLCITRCLV